MQEAYPSTLLDEQKVSETFKEIRSQSRYTTDNHLDNEITIIKAET